MDVIGSLSARIKVSGTILGWFKYSQQGRLSGLGFPEIISPPVETAGLK